MKRICLVGAALAALLTAGVTTAATAKPAARHHKPHFKVVLKPKKVSSRVSCKLAITTQISPGDTAVLQGAASGSQYGSAGCGKPLYRGIERTAFTTNNDGTIVGRWQQWFNAGSAYGTYTLTPQETTGPPTDTTFAEQSYRGSLAVKSGTGLFAKVVGKGTLQCTSPDQAHYACTETATMTQTVLVPVKVRVG